MIQLLATIRFSTSVEELIKFAVHIQQLGQYRTAEHFVQAVSVKAMGPENWQTVYSVLAQVSNSAETCPAIDRLLLIVTPRTLMLLTR